MELLRKTIVKEDGHEDNSDKKPLFGGGRHLRAANLYKDDWSFIKNPRERENIAYQMQYLEFLICLYNEYKIYLTVESLMCKNMMVIIAGVVEDTLFDLVNRACEKINLKFDKITDSVKLIREAFDMGLIDNEMKDNFHNLRKIRNLIHLKGIEYQECKAYKIDEVNHYLEILEKFRVKQK